MLAKGAVNETSYTLTYDDGGSTTPTCATPTFSPAAGAVASGTKVSISSTEGATIYYTTDGSNPTSSSYVYQEPIEITEATTIKAYAVKSDYDDSSIAEAAYTIKQVVSGYAIDFESDLDDYTDWAITNAVKSNSDIDAHGGSYFATTGGKETASFQTKEKVAYPDVFTCYISKTTKNTTSSTWKIQVSSDGSTWTDVGTKSATGMNAGTWQEFTADIKAAGHTNVYVRLFYTGSTAVRTVDDITLTTYTPAAVEAPSITVPSTFTISTTATITCVTEGATIYYSYDNATWAEYTAPLTITETRTIYAKATKGEDESAVAQATATKELATANVSISTAAINVGETASVTTDGPAVTLATSDADVASVSGTTVTAVGAGTATITATWEANRDYAAGSKDFTIIVTDPNAAGGQNNPYTVAQALEATPASGNSATVYVRGIVSAFYNTSIMGDGNNYRYYISDDGTTTTQLLVYGGKGLNNVAFSSDDDLHVGDHVIITGRLTTYSGTKEFNSGNYIFAFENPTHKVTFSIDGTETTAESEVMEGTAITFPANPADINGKTFVGWTTAEIEDPTDTKPSLLIEATMGTTDVTYYAVFATLGESVTTSVTDQLTHSTIGVTVSSYTEWSGKTATSDAIYAGQSAGGDTNSGDCIQLRSKDSNSGVVTTTSGGKATKVAVVWNSATASGRTINVYGKNTAYEAATDLYDNSKQGTLIGTIVNGTSTELTISDEYTFIGVRSNSGALYLNELNIDWSSSATSYSGYCTTVTTPDSEAYAVVVTTTEGETTSKAVTFYYDGKKSSREGEIVKIEQGYSEYRDWKGSDLTSATFDASFKNYTGLISTYSWFDGCSNLTTIAGLENLNTENVTDMGSMFNNCKKLTSLDLSSFNTAKVTHMSSMFANCQALTSITFGSNFNTSSVKTFKNMFWNCLALTSLDVTGFNTESATNMNSMFGYCKNLTNLDLSSFNTAKVTDMRSMFYYCMAITTIYVGDDWTTGNVTDFGSMFVSNNNLVGGNGTKFTSSSDLRSFARIDGNRGAGYLSHKTKKYVTIGEAGYTTFVPTANVSAADDVEFFGVDKINETSMHLLAIENAIPANTPIIIKAAAGIYDLPIAESAEEVTGNLLKASDGTVTGDGSTIYALGVGKTGDVADKVGFFPVKNDVKVPAGKAYIEVPESGSAKAYLAFNFGDTDAIESVDENVDDNAEIYNLAGQRLQKLQRGVNIVGGRKFIVK